jgi:membrane dipeptidase
VKNPLVVDAHEDLAWNILTFGRDYVQSAEHIRRAEAGSLAPVVNDDTVLGWPEYQRGRVAVVFSTLFVAPFRYHMGEWDTQYYADTNQAYRLYQAQLDAYDRLTTDHPDKFRLIHTQGDLQAVLAEWNQDEGQTAEKNSPPVGLVVLMEGAECVREPADLEEWWQRGVRLIGPAWAGNRFCGGTREPGPLTTDGTALLEGMAEVGFCLDLTHMDEEAVLQALDIYPGQIVASHSNAVALLDHPISNRLLSDRVIHGILERGGVIGIVPFNAFLQAGWERGERRQGISLQHVVAQIDYICQMAGDAHHVGIGSDFDGGFGLQSVPTEIDTIADLQKLAPMLGEKGYSEEDIAAILGKNWLSCLQQVLS